MDVKDLRLSETQRAKNTLAALETEKSYIETHLTSMAPDAPERFRKESRLSEVTKAIKAAGGKAA